MPSLRVKFTTQGVQTARTTKTQIVAGAQSITNVSIMASNNSAQSDALTRAAGFRRYVQKEDLTSAL